MRRVAAVVVLVACLLGLAFWGSLQSKDARSAPSRSSATPIPIPTLGDLIRDDSPTLCDTIAVAPVTMAGIFERLGDQASVCFDSGAQYLLMCGNAPSVIMATPTANDVWLVCAVAVDNHGTSPIDVSPKQFELVTSSGERYRSLSTPPWDDPSRALVDQIIAPGDDEIGGALLFSIDKDDTVPFIVVIQAQGQLGYVAVLALVDDLANIP